MLKDISYIKTKMRLMWFNMICNEGLYTINEYFSQFGFDLFRIKEFLNKSFENKNSFRVSLDLFIHEYI